MRRLILLFLPLLLAILMLAAPASAAEETNLLVNPDFEELTSDGLPVGWFTDAWFTQEGYSYFTVSDDAHEGSHSAAVNNVGSNDARFAQTVKVEPESLYRLSGWIKADSIQDSGWGANLSVSGVYSSTDGIFSSTGEWQYVELYGETGEEQTEITVFARVGGYSGESTGKALFDGISLVKVDSVPGNEVADMWFYPSSSSNEQTTTEDEEQEASPFWPWLLALSALYLALGFGLAAMLRQDRAQPEMPGRVRPPLLFILGLILAFVLRWFIACRVVGYQVDINCFLSWGHTMASGGAADFYQSTSFCDYPPGYVYIMGLNRLISNAINGIFGHTPEILRAENILKLVPMLCDLGIAGVLYTFARDRRFSRDQAGALGLLVAFNPVLVINSAAWGQVDSVLALLLMLVALFAIQRKWTALMPVYMLAVLIKPQALMLGFLGLTAIVLDWIHHKEDRKPMLIGTGLAILTAAIIVIPFSIRQASLSWLFDLYGSTLSSYAYATINTANLYYLFNANWAAITNQAGWGVGMVLALVSAGWGAWVFVSLRKKGDKLLWAEPALMALFTVFFVFCAITGQTWTVVGYGAMALAFAIVLPMFIRCGKMELLPLAGGVLFLLMYVLGIKMHERYLFPALIFFAMAYTVRRSTGILSLLLITSVTVFVNEGIVLDNSVRLGSSMGHLNNDTYALNMILSAINVLTIPLAFRVCIGSFYLQEEEATDRHTPLWKRIPMLSGKPGSEESFSLDHRLHWRRLDTILICSVTAVYAVIAFWNLGSTKAPQKAWTSTTPQEYVTIDLGKSYRDFSMLYYCGVSYSDFYLETSEDGENWSGLYWAEMSQGQCYRWKYLMPVTNNDNENRTYSGSNRYAGVQLLSGRYVRITANQINLVLDEVIFRESSAYVNNDGNTVPTSGARITGLTILERGDENTESSLLSDPANLIDEQDVMDGGLEPGWYTGTYFDEIYHARTAYEHLHGTTPYETTHPPLGKVIMSWFVAVFGMTPFGWRFAGALAGVLMLPVMYLIGKQLTKKTWVGFTAMVILALDCMHYTQTRIATIDSFPVLFIIASWLFMVRFMQRDIVLTPIRRLLPDLALSGFFAGCAIASKWIGLYSGVGLALMFFWTCSRHLRLMRLARERLDAVGTPQKHQPDPLGADVRSRLAKRSRGTVKQLLLLCCWCVLFFVIVPVTIYLLSYIPYFAYAKPQSLTSFIDMVIRAQQSMFSYHSTPGLGMDHPFYSPWYEWPVIARPMYYAMAYFTREGQSFSIFCFGNPAVWYAGIIGIACTVLAWARRHVYRYGDSGITLHLRAADWQVETVFVLAGLLAQFLPWVLVPRGTYIYHYFASVPFLVLGTSLSLYWLEKRFSRIGRIMVILYLVLCLGMFIAWFPYASGMSVSTQWLDFMSNFLHVYHS